MHNLHYIIQKLGVSEKLMFLFIKTLQKDQRNWSIDPNYPLIIIINVSWSSDLHIKVICEGSCDTEDWSNDAENHRNKLHFTIYSHRKQMIYIGITFHNFYCIFDQINAAWLNRRDFF